MTPTDKAEDEIVEIGVRALTPQLTWFEWDNLSAMQRDSMRKKFKAIRAAFHSAGLVLVPSEPTEAMREAFPARDSMEQFRRYYRAMLDAAKEQKP